MLERFGQALKKTTEQFLEHTKRFSEQLEAEFRASLPM